MTVIVPIVEGHSEVAGVPELLRRLLAEFGSYRITIARPFRVKRNRVTRPGEIERGVVQAIRSRQGAAAVIVILDGDDDDPAVLGPQLLERCRGATALPVSVVLARRELEAWFLGAKESLRGFRGIRDDAVAPPDPESIRGAKERLTQNMARRGYVEVDDQPAFASRFDLVQARARCPSFELLVRELKALVALLEGSPAESSNRREPDA